MTDQQKTIDHLQQEILLLSQKKMHPQDWTLSWMGRKLQMAAESLTPKTHIHSSRNLKQITLITCSFPVALLLVNGCAWACLSSYEISEYGVQSVMSVCVSLCLSVSACGLSVNVWKQKVEKIKPNWPENSTDTFAPSNTHTHCLCARVCICMSKRAQYQKWPERERRKKGICFKEKGQERREKWKL